MSVPFVRRLVAAGRRRPRLADGTALGVVAAGMVGVMLGSGIANIAVDVSDGVAWLTDSARGELLQYNPNTQQVERAYRVANPGEIIDLVQGNGLAAVRNQATGRIITVDMSRMQSGGVRDTGPGAQAKVLVGKGMMFVADTVAGTVVRIDPVRATDIGTTWQAGPGISDAVVDGQGAVWAMQRDGELHKLEWDDRDQSLVSRSSARIDRITDDGRLTPHAGGTTAFGARHGVINQVGTRMEFERQSDELVGIEGAQSAPEELVPGTLTEKAIAVIADRGTVRQVATAPLGCARPTKPTAYNNTVFIVCDGADKMLQLRPDGQLAGPDVPIPSGDVQLVVDEGRLLVTVEGLDEGVEIGRDGQQKRFSKQLSRAPEELKTDGSAGGGTQVALLNARQDLVRQAAPRPAGLAHPGVPLTDRPRARTEVARPRIEAALQAPSAAEIAEAVDRQVERAAEPQPVGQPATQQPARPESGQAGQESQAPVASGRESQAPVSSGQESQAPVASGRESQAPGSSGQETQVPVPSAQESQAPSQGAEEAAQPGQRAESGQDSRPAPSNDGDRPSESNPTANESSAQEPERPRTPRGQEPSRSELVTEAPASAESDARRSGEEGRRPDAGAQAGTRGRHQDRRDASRAATSDPSAPSGEAAEDGADEDETAEDVAAEEVQSTTVPAAPSARTSASSEISVSSRAAAGRRTPAPTPHVATSAGTRERAPASSPAGTASARTPSAATPSARRPAPTAAATPARPKPTSSPAAVGRVTGASCVQSGNGAMTVRWRSGSSTESVGVAISGAASRSTRVAGTARSATFVNVPAGAYSFTVRTSGGSAISGSCAVRATTAAPSTSIRATPPRGARTPAPPAAGRAASADPGRAAPAR